MHARKTMHGHEQIVGALPRNQTVMTERHRTPPHHFNRDAIEHDARDVPCTTCLAFVTCATTRPTCLARPTWCDLSGPPDLPGLPDLPGPPGLPDL